MTQSVAAAAGSEGANRLGRHSLAADKPDDRGLGPATNSEKQDAVAAVEGAM